MRFHSDSGWQAPTPKKFNLQSRLPLASLARANQLWGIRHACSSYIFYFPQNTPRRSISCGVKSGVDVKPGVEIAPRLRRALVAIAFLHPVVNDDGACAHQFASVSAGVAAKLG